MLIRIGVACMGLSFISLGYSDNIEDSDLFVTVSLLTRFLQGFSSAAIQTACYSISTNFYPEHKEALVGYIEAVTGVGLILGPLIGTVLYSAGGYGFTFYAFSTFFVAFFFFITCLFPKKLDVVSDEDKNMQTQEMYTSLSRSFTGRLSEGEVTIGKLLSDKRFFFAGATASLAYFCYGYMEPLLALRLKDFDLNQTEISYFFTILPLFYIISSVLVQFTPSFIEKRFVLIVACSISFFSNLLTGPS